LNEAFAAQVLACLVVWMNERYCQQDGGGISLGHPVGASGARIVLHLCKILRREGAARGVATLCIGGGQGGAMLIERMAT
jgi:acetyl-CoA C-acetyltransferase